MNDLQNLWVLQQLEIKELDLKWLKNNNEIAVALRSIKQDIERQQEEYLEIKGDYMRTENEIKQVVFLIDESKNKMRVLEDKLISGTITSSKEIKGLESRILDLKGKIADLESKQVEFWDKQKAFKEKLVRLAKKLKTQKEEFYKKREEYNNYAQKITEEINKVLSEKEKVDKKIAAETKKLFENMRKEFKNPIALVEKGICLGCNIKLTSDKVRVLKLDKQVQYCDKCGRLLFIKKAHNRKY